MGKKYCKRLEEYEEPSEFDEEGFLKAMKRVAGRRKPTSVALEQKVIDDLKKQALKRHIPYQVLMRVLITQGLKRLKKKVKST